MRFDFASFLIGLVTAAAIAYVLYRLRDRISALRRSVEATAGQTREFVTNSAESRYYDHVIKSFNAQHIAGEAAKLTEIYVEPRFLPAPLPQEPNAEKIGSIFHVIPLVHEFPASYAPYNLETLGVNDLRAGARHLALLGMPGAGRSTALAVMGLVAAGEIDLPDINVMEDESFEAELQNLPPAERELKIKARRELQERALRQLSTEQARSGDSQTAALPKWTEFLPIYAHLSDLDLSTAALTGTTEAGKARPVDPAEPLVRALQRNAGGVVASTLPRVIYSRLTAGRALVMLDGFDEIPSTKQHEVIGWLQKFIELYQASYIVVVSGVQGYDPLVNVGLTPIYLRAWQDEDYETLVQRWAAQWPVIGKQGRRAAPMPEEKVVRRAATNNRGRIPLDVTLKTWAAFSGDEKEVGRRGWYDFYVRHQQAEQRPLLEKLAALILDQNGTPVSLEQIKTMVTGTVTGPDGKPTANVDDLVNKLLRSSLVRELPGGQYTLIHPMIGAFLASETLTPESLVNAANHPGWEPTLAFAAIRLPFDAVAQARVTAAQQDLLYASVFSLVSTLLDSPSNAAWRGIIFKQLGAALLQPSQFPAIRELAMAALVTSRDKGVLYILREGLKAPIPIIRQYCCVGLGALGEPDAIKELAPMLADPDPDVQLSAGMALAAIGTDAALNTMMDGLLAGDPQLRRAVAEALAAIPGVGHATLRDALNSSELDLRRAAVYGLARIKAGWALAALYKTLFEDGEWVVRNAAEDAFKEAQRPDRGGVSVHPSPDQLEWLVSWAASRGEGVPAGPTGRQMLVRALQEGDPAMRAAAARALGSLGHPSALKALYNALRDRDETVRAAVYEALSMLQHRHNTKLPAVS